MLLFRMGPRYLFIRTEYTDEMEKLLKENLNGDVTDFNHGFERASDSSTLCFLTDINHEKTRVEDANKIILVNDVSTVILSTIINSKVCSLLHRVDMGPASVVVRMAGDGNKLMEKIKERFDGQEVDIIEGIGLGEKDDTLIAFTNRVINGPVAADDFIEKKLLIRKPIREVQEKLRLEGLRLLTQCLNESKWHELRINIYDSKGKYEKNYERLMFILSKLEIGMILGESWTKDYAVLLYSVLTYQVRLFTYSTTPHDVKKILMALEYTKDGERLVDFDLYYKNKKIYWHEVDKEKKKKESKMDIAKVFRETLYEKLKPEDIEKLESMEKSILKN